MAPNLALAAEAIQINDTIDPMGLVFAIVGGFGLLLLIYWYNTRR